MDLSSLFEQLGFSEKEARVYQALVLYGPSPVSTLAQRTHIKRTSVYDLLNGLVARNLITSFGQGSHMYFAVDDLNKLHHEQKERAAAAQHLIETLRRNQGVQPGIQVNYYKGQEGYRELYEDILRARPQELLAWLHLDYFLSAIDPVREEAWTLERIEKKIHARLLLQDTPFARQFQKQDAGRFRKTRLIPKSRFFETSCFLYEGFVIFFDATKEVSAIRIQSADLFHMQKEIFEMNWEK